MLSIPKIKFDFAVFFGCLSMGIKGELHEAHSYFLRFYLKHKVNKSRTIFKRAGINSITLKGFNKNKVTQTSSTNGYSPFSKFFKLEFVFNLN